MIFILKIGSASYRFDTKSVHAIINVFGLSQ
jgi:hypothetical protein